MKKFRLPRAYFLGIAILLQLILFIGLITRFTEVFRYFYGFSVVLSWIAVLYIVSNNSNPAYKISWIILILTFPVFGGILYVYLGRSRTSRHFRKRLSDINDATIKAFECVGDVRHTLKNTSLTASLQSKYIEDYAMYPAFRNQGTKYFSLGEHKHLALLEELKAAKEFIFLEYFIIDLGNMWDSILHILIEKANQGLDIRLIYDDFGTLTTFEPGYKKTLEKHNIKVAVFNPLIPFLAIRMNNRDHRKMVIIDGVVAFTGGINIADEYINEIQRFGHWKDAGLLVKGEAVYAFTVMFITMWDQLSKSKNPTNIKAYMRKSQLPYEEGFIQPFSDSPLDDEPVGETVYLNLINRAKESIYITTPYLIISNEMVTAFVNAAKAGVKVHIITPHLGDKWYVQAVSRSYYDVLIASGVKIYEYTPGFIHSKTFLVDDIYGVVGTINLDYRSLFLHFENAVWLFKTPCLQDLKKDVLHTLALSKEVTKTDLAHVSFIRKGARKILRLFAPLM